ELGAGKSFLCRYIHRRRGGAAGNLWVIQCGAGGGTLKQKLGSLLERAAEGDPESKGTLVLEQVEELPPEWQHQFVGFLEATGDTGLRVLATTRGALKKAVDAGHFREDLYWRLGVLQLRVPPLRERKDDLEPLLAAFLVQVAREPIPFSGEGLSRLLRYRWPGNVRELGSFAQRYWLLWKGLPLFPAEERERMALDDFLSAVEEDALRAPIAVIPGTLESMEAQIMSEMARRIKGSKAEVARRLGISRTTLWKRMKEAGRAPAGGEGMIG
ncbi:MAG TPA: sigma-54-dependent Fis family transcriptional regulator, partial [Firmicutes bacterium]|nr:sigma-54-dependent Fis family transcriptional regulator [Bacillota bacterium]